MYMCANTFYIPVVRDWTLKTASLPQKGSVGTNGLNSFPREPHFVRENPPGDGLMERWRYTKSPVGLRFSLSRSLLHPSSPSWTPTLPLIVFLFLSFPPLLSALAIACSVRYSILILFLFFRPSLLLVLLVLLLLLRFHKDHRLFFINARVVP